MPAFINRYVHVITEEAHALIENKYEKLNPLQKEVVQSILEHTKELSMLMLIGQAKDELRHELLNVLTPISGYVDMLSDGWMGKLSEEQIDRVKLINVAVRRLTEYVRSFPVVHENASSYSKRR